MYTNCPAGFKRPVPVGELFEAGQIVLRRLGGAFRQLALKQAAGLARNSTVPNLQGYMGAVLSKKM